MSADSAVPVTYSVRGTVLRDTNAGPGLLSVNQRQLPFTLEQHWRGQSAPVVNMTVDVLLDSAGAAVSVSPVADSELTKEQLDRVKADLSKAAQTHLPKLLAMADKAGKPVLLAIAALAVAWLWLPAVSVRLNAAMTQSATMFDVLRLLNSGASLESMGQLGGGSSGLYGLLCVLAMFAPLAPSLLAARWARYGYFAPLAFMAVLATGIYLKINSLASAASEGMRSFGGAGMGKLAEAMLKEALSAVSVGYGSYIALIAAAYLAWRGLAAVLASRS